MKEIKQIRIVVTADVVTLGDNYKEYIALVTSAMQEVLGVELLNVTTEAKEIQSVPVKEVDEASN